MFNQHSHVGPPLTASQRPPALEDEKVEEEGKRVLDRKKFPNTLAYLEEWQGSWKV